MDNDFHPWTRRWYAADARVQTSTGYASDDMSPASVTLDTFDAASCLVLLGAPGMGKSHEAVSEIGRLRSLGHAANLVLGGRTQRLEADLDTILATVAAMAADSPRIRYIFVDGVDEIAGPDSAAADILERFLRRLHELAGVVRLRFLCRTTAWTSRLDAMVESFWAEGNSHKLLLAPLTREDVAATIRREIGRDGRADQLLRSIDAAGVQTFASWPLLLPILIDLFRRNGEVPLLQTDIYRQGLEGLLARNIRLFGTQPTMNASAWLMLAARMATAMSFSGAEAVTAEHTVEEAGTVVLAEIASGTEPNPPIKFAVDYDQLLAVLETPLFVKHGDGGYRLFHRSVQEFLTAHYLVAHGLSVDDLTDLLSVKEPNGQARVAPQMREVAAWVACMAPPYFDHLVEREPQILLLSDVAAVTARQRASLTAALIDHAARGELFEGYWGLRPSFAKLAHPALAEQIEPYLQNRRQDGHARRVAVDIASMARLSALGPLLADIARDVEEPVELRKAAVDAVAQLDLSVEIGGLVTILSDGLDTDLDDELRGAVLRATWPAHLNLAELLAALTPAKVDNLVGAYAAFLYKLKLQSLSRDDALAGIAWLRTQLPHVRDYGSVPESRRVPPIVFWGVAATIGDHEVRAAFAPLLADILEAYAHSFFEVLYDTGSQWPSSVRPRSALVLEMLSRADDPVGTSRLVRYALHGLICKEDLSSYADMLRSGAATDLLPAIVDIVVGLSRNYPIDELDDLWRLGQHVPQLAEALDKTYKTLLDATEVSYLRRQWQREHRRETSGQKPEQKTSQWSDRIAAMLDRIEQGEIDLWWQLNLQLFVRAGGEYEGLFEFRSNLKEAPGWPRLNEVERARIVRTAAQYLSAMPLPDLRWLGTKTGNRPANAGLRALRLLFDEDPGALEALSPAIWSKWAPAILSFFDNHFETDGPAQIALLRQAWTHAPDSVGRTLVRIALGPHSDGLTSRIFELLTPMFDSRLAELLRRLAPRPRLKADTGQGDIVAFLVEMGDQTAIETLIRDLQAPRSSRSASDAVLAKSATALLRAHPLRMWMPLLALRNQDPELASAIWTEFASARQYSRKSVLIHIPELGLAQAYLDLRELLPETLAHSTEARFLSAVDYIDQLRSALLERLVSLGTAAAVEQLRRIAETYPDEDRHGWRQREALARFREQNRRLHQPAGIIALVAARSVELPAGTPTPADPVPFLQSDAPSDAVPDDPALPVPQPAQLPEPDAIDHLNILALGTEWLSAHGGLSTVNRELCIALAELGHRVVCAVINLTEADKLEAKAGGVVLVGCPLSPGIEGEHRLLLLGDRDLTEFHPDIVIGHDHKTGPAGLVLADRFGARYVHMLHTVPDESEAFKRASPGEQANILKGERKTRAQQELCRQADLVIGVGPKIHDHAARVMQGTTPTHLLMPGLNIALMTQEPDAERRLVNHCLLIGRMEDADLKGIKLGLRAMQRACDNHDWDAGMRPWLVLMGFDSQTADDQLAAVVEVPDHRQYVQARAFSTDVDEIHRTLRTSSMLIMPSLSEGFGLTGYEAIAAGIPVLISNESGLAIYLDRAAKGGKISSEIVDRVIVRVVGEPQRVADIWSARMIDQLSDPERAFAEARTLREGLRSILTWDNAARQLTTAFKGILL